MVANRQEDRPMLLQALLLCQFFGIPETSSQAMITSKDPIAIDIDADGQLDTISNFGFLTFVRGDIGIKSSRSNTVTFSPSAMGGYSRCSRIWMGKFAPGNSIDFISLLSDNNNVTPNTLYLHRAFGPNSFSPPTLLYSFAANQGSFSNSSDVQFIDRRGLAHIAIVGECVKIFQAPTTADVYITIDPAQGILVGGIGCPASDRVKYFRTPSIEGLLTCNIDRRAIYIETSPGNFVTNYVSHNILELDVGDMDLDGSDDIVILEDNNIYIYYLDAGGSIRGNIQIPIIYTQCRSLAVGYIDGDMTPDIAYLTWDNLNTAQINVHLSTNNFLQPVTQDTGLVMSASGSNTNKFDSRRISFCNYAQYGNVLKVWCYDPGSYVVTKIFPLPLSPYANGIMYSNPGAMESRLAGTPNIGSNDLWMIVHSPNDGPVIPIFSRGSLSTPITPWPGCPIFLYDAWFSLQQQDIVNGYLFYHIGIPQDNNLLYSTWRYQIFESVNPIISSNLTTLPILR